MSICNVYVYECILYTHIYTYMHINRYTLIYYSISSFNNISCQYFKEWHAGKRQPPSPPPSLWWPLFHCICWVSEVLSELFSARSAEMWWTRYHRYPDVTPQNQTRPAACMSLKSWVYFFFLYRWRKRCMYIDFLFFLYKWRREILSRYVALLFSCFAIFGFSVFLDLFSFGDFFARPGGR